MLRKVIPKIVFSIFLVLLFYFGAVAAFLTLIYNYSEVWFIILFYFVYIILFLILLAVIWAKKGFFKKIKYIPLIIFTVGALLTGIYIIQASNDRNIPVINDQDINLYFYQPYGKESKLVKLNEEPKLSLKSNLPKLDCSAAFYQTVASFVEAVYPKGIYSPYSENGIFYQTDDDKAYERLIKGDVDVIFVQAPSVSQKNDARKAGVELNLTPICKEAFVFFVNSKNHVDNLTKEQIQEIYSGNITSWGELGGKNEKILAFQNPEGSKSQTALIKIMKGIKLIDPIVNNVVDAMSGIMEKTASYKNYKNAIGCSFRYFTSELLKNNQIKLLSIDGTIPDNDNIKSGKYPFVSEFYAVTTGTANENTKKFIEWILSSQGQYIIEETGYVPIKK